MKWTFVEMGKFGVGRIKEKCLHRCPLGRREKECLTTCLEYFFHCSSYEIFLLMKCFSSSV